MKRALPFLLIAALAGAVAVDAVWPASRPQAPQAAPYQGGGILACPMAVAPPGRALLHLGNLGSAAASVRISVVPQKGTPVVLRQTLRPGQTRNVTLNGRVDGRASVVVEHTGGQVAASHSMWFPRRPQRRGAPAVLRPAGAVAAVCRAAGPGATVLPHLGTSNGREVVLAVYNPGAADAEISIALHTGRRILTPESLKSRGIPPRRFRIYQLEDFAFNINELAAIVTSSAGRVVAEAMQIAPSGVSLVEGDPAARSLVSVSGASGRPAQLGLVSAGGEDTGLEGSLFGTRSQGRAARVPPDLRPGHTAEAFTPSLSKGGPVAYGIDVTVGSPIGAGTGWPVQRGGSDNAAVGSVAPALRWVAAAGAPLERATIRAVIANPGDGPASVRVRRLGGEGRADLVIDAGRVARLPLGSGKGSVAIDVTSDEPVVLMLEGSGSETIAGLETTYGFGMYGHPVDEHGPVPVGIDPRAGVPAPLLGRDQ